MVAACQVGWLCPYGLFWEAHPLPQDDIETAKLVLADIYEL